MAFIVQLYTGEKLMADWGRQEEWPYTKISDGRFVFSGDDNPQILGDKVACLQIESPPQTPGLLRPRISTPPNEKVLLRNGEHLQVPVSRETTLLSPIITEGMFRFAGSPEIRPDIGSTLKFTGVR